MVKVLLVPVAPPSEADNVTPVPTVLIVTVPVHCPFVKVTEAGFIVPGPVEADIEVELPYPVTVLLYWSRAVMVIWKPTPIVFGLVIVLNVKWFKDAELTVIGLLVRNLDAESSRTVIVRVPEVLSENPLKVCDP